MAMITQSHTLLIRHLPASLTHSEKVDFLKHFGAKEVRVMSHQGRMKHASFATFNDLEDAKKAIRRLHQVKMYDSVLSVEFAKKLPVHHTEEWENSVRSVTSPEKLNGKKGSVSSETDSSVEKKSAQKNVTANLIASHLGIDYPSDPGIRYRYPPANGDILLNICSALASVPKFYVQVLHLMNKMHLLPPFTPTNTVTPLILERLKEIWPSLPQFNENSAFIEPDKVEVVEMSESESEYESNESEGEGRLKSLDMGVPERVVKSRKRKQKKSHNTLKKKMRIAQPLPKPTPIESQVKSISNVADAFEDSNVESFRKPIEIKVQALPADENTNVINPSNEKPCNAGFGKFQPTALTGTACDEIQKTTEDKILKDFITQKQLSNGRLIEKEIKSSSLFQNYKKGDPNCRLYVKNLSKRVTEKDLEFIYGSFVNYDDENETNMFDIQLLKQGRMKGQAFVGFSTVDKATAALNATNGYQLMNKPMVVHFARSKKPKEHE